MLQLFQAALHGRRASKTEGQKAYIVSLVQDQKDLVFMKELLEAGRVVPVIDGCYPLSKTAEALWYFEKEHAHGKVVITVELNGR
jgi:NADPH:quinone reductase-like Zn-dependent oxidoreductase